VPSCRVVGDGTRTHATVSGVVHAASGRVVGPGVVRYTDSVAEFVARRLASLSGREVRRVDLIHIERDLVAITPAVARPDPALRHAVGVHKIAL